MSSLLKTEIFFSGPFYRIRHEIKEIFVLFRPSFIAVGS